MLKKEIQVLLEVQKLLEERMQTLNNLKVASLRTYNKAKR
jgi:hypothetical protein